MTAIRKVTAVRGAKEKCLSVNAAAKYLGVSQTTILTWIAVGKIETIDKTLAVKRVGLAPGARARVRVTCSECGRQFPGDNAGLAIFCVRVSSLQGAFNATCLLCGKEFTSKHPRKARFCSAQHRNDWHMHERSLARKLRRSTPKG